MLSGLGFTSNNDHNTVRWPQFGYLISRNGVPDVAKQNIRRLSPEEDPLLTLRLEGRESIDGVDVQSSEGDHFQQLCDRRSEGEEYFQVEEGEQNGVAVHQVTLVVRDDAVFVTARHARRHLAGDGVAYRARR